MKKLKKFAAFSIAVALMLSAVGCSGGDNANPKDQSAEESTAGKESGSEASGENNSDKGSGSGQTDTGAAKKYTIATDTVFAPFEFTDADNNFVGIDIDIMNAIAEDQGFEVEFNSLGFDAALMAVEAGQAEGVIAGMSITDDRKAKFDFSEAYYEADVTMAVAANSDITSYEALKGLNVAIKTGTNGADFAKSIADEYGFTITEFKDSPTMYQDVIVGNSAACFEDYPVMAYNIKQGAKLQIPEGINEAGSSYGFAVKKGQNAELVELFNAGLENIKANGIYDEIVDKYTK